jgi:hypothetical protein
VAGAKRTLRADFRWGVAKLVKAPDFDSGIRGFESFLPSHFHRRDGGTPAGASAVIFSRSEFRARRVRAA